MKPEDKAALKAGGTTAVVAGALATCLANPVAWAAVLYGTYRIGKAAREIVRERSKAKTVDQDFDLYI
jgi:hypothetical protein